jgi:hypothetical protein
MLRRIKTFAAFRLTGLSNCSAILQMTGPKTAWAVCPLELDKTGLWVIVRYMTEDENNAPDSAPSFQRASFTIKRERRVSPEHATAFRDRAADRCDRHGPIEHPYLT